MAITLGKDLVIQDDSAAISTTYCDIGMRGTGKSYLMLKYAEQAMRAGGAHNFIDPQGICHGLRALPNGKPSEFKLLLLGGPHGADLPLKPEQGPVVAEACVARPHTNIILDISQFRKEETRKFIAAYLKELFMLKNTSREPMMLYLDEAHLWAPQLASREAAHVIGALEDICGRGRQRGLFLFCTTQRAAKLNKNVLSQIETIFMFRQSGTDDRKAMKGYLDGVYSREQVEAAMKELPTLDTGECILFSPWFMGAFKKFTVGPRETFDSSSTPLINASKGSTIKATYDRDTVETWRELLDPPRKAKAAPISPAKAAPAAAKPQIVERTVEVATSPWTPEEQARALELIQRLPEVISGAQRELKELAALIVKASKAGRKLVVSKPRAMGQTALRNAVKAEQAEPPVEQASSKRRVSVELPEGPTKLLNKLAEFTNIGMEIVDKDTLAMSVGLKRGGSTARAQYAALVKAGAVHYPQTGQVQLTDQGRDMAAWPDTPMTLGGLHDTIRGMLKNPARITLLNRILEAWPEKLTKDELCDLLGVEASGSTARAHFAALRNVGAIDYPSVGTVVASELLFPEALR